MKPYVHGPKVLSLEQERARLQAEIAEHHAILAKQQELARVRAQVARNIGAESAAEQIRARAFIINGDGPAACRARLDTAAKEAGTWRRTHVPKQT